MPTSFDCSTRYKDHQHDTIADAFRYYGDEELKYTASSLSQMSTMYWSPDISSRVRWTIECLMVQHRDLEYRNER